MRLPSSCARRSAAPSSGLRASPAIASSFREQTLGVARENLFDESRYVEHQRHALIAELGGAGDAPHVLERFPSARILFVGDGDDRAELEKSIGERGLENAILIQGFRFDVPEIIAGSDALLLPSRVEGFGYVLVEAMAAAVPCIASNVSSIPEIVEDGVTGILHPVGDIGAIANAINFVLANPEAARAMGEAGQRVAREKFNLPRMLDQVEQVLFE